MDSNNNNNNNKMKQKAYTRTHTEAKNLDFSFIINMTIRSCLYTEKKRTKKSRTFFSKFSLLGQRRISITEHTKLNREKKENTRLEMSYGVGEALGASTVDVFAVTVAVVPAAAAVVSVVVGFVAAAFFLERVPLFLCLSP